MLPVYNDTKDCIMLDPNPHLPKDWPPAGKGENGDYFHNAVHENAKGYRAVFDALFEDLKLKVKKFE
jgi:lysophospholipase L1-like esterase